MSGGADTQTVRWHPRREPVPPGWRLVADAPAHHARHSVLIEPLKRKVGRSHVMHFMSTTEWRSSRTIAEAMRRANYDVHRLLRHALKRGWVEKQRGVCAIGNRRAYVWRIAPQKAAE